MAKAMAHGWASEQIPIEFISDFLCSDFKLLRLRQENAQVYRQFPDTLCEERVTMKTKYALFILLTSMMAVGCSSMQDDEANIPDTSGEVSEPIAAETDAVPAPAEETQPIAAVEEAPAAPAEEPLAPVEPIISDLAEAAPAAPVEEQPLAEQAPLAEVAPIVEAPMITEPVAAAPAEETHDGQVYKVKHGDTLMKIAFEHYGDLYRWREIYEANRGKIQDPNAVPPGTRLSLNGAGMVTIEKNGEQYLIKNGDTLGTISNDVYGTKSKWKSLWENNRQMIKDPNRIYAGFYLFYQPARRMTGAGDSGKEPASL